MAKADHVDVSAGVLWKDEWLRKWEELFDGHTSSGDASECNDLDDIGQQELQNALADVDGDSPALQ